MSPNYQREYELCKNKGCNKRLNLKSYQVAQNKRFVIYDLMITYDYDMALIRLIENPLRYNLAHNILKMACSNLSFMEF